MDQPVLASFLRWPKGPHQFQTFSIRCFLEKFILEMGTAWISVEKQVDVVVDSVWVGCLFLIYYFFVSVEALKCRLSSNDAHESLDSSTEGGGG